MNGCPRAVRRGHRLRHQIETSCVLLARPGDALPVASVLARLPVKAGHNRIGRSGIRAGWREAGLAAMRTGRAPKGIEMATNFRAFSFATATLAGAAFMALADWPAAAAGQIAVRAALTPTRGLSSGSPKVK